MEEFYKDPALVDAFVVESEELLQAMDQDLVGLENAPGNDELLNRIFRACTQSRVPPGSPASLLSCSSDIKPRTFSTPCVVVKFSSPDQR